VRFKTLFFTLALACIAGASLGMNLDDTFHFMTTLVVTSTPVGQKQSTGFYYHHLAPGNSSKTGPQWCAVQNTWLVTNRHVILPKIDGKEVMPTTFAFHLRRIDGNKLRWDPITLTKEELLKRARFHKHSEVDVAVVDVHDLLLNKVKGDGKYLQWYSVSPDNFAGQNNINVQASDDVIAIGYPRGFYDEVNLYPIVKSGIIASRWGTNFNGKPYFLIDAKLFPGSSGSIVLSKPTDFVVKDGQVCSAKEKQFAFLGIFSGEPIKLERPVELEGMIITEKAGFNVGVVWYANLVEEIISNGESLTP
jgi:hypothetical protein